MISTIEYEKTMRVRVPVEHPDDLSETEVRALADSRALDIAPKLCWYDCPESTALTKVYLGVEMEPEHEDYGMCMPSKPKPFNLVDEDPMSEE